MNKKPIFKRPLFHLSLLGLITIVGLVYAYLYRDYLDKDGLVSIGNYIDVFVKNHYTISVFVFILILTIWSTLLPTAIPIVLAGYLYGFWLGSVFVIISTTTAFLISFFAARRFGGESMQNYLSTHPRFQKVEKTLSRNGWKLVFLFRLSPVVPYHIQNYAYGISDVKFKTCLTATLAGKIPNVLATVAVGCVARNFQTIKNSPYNLWLLILGAVSTIVLMYIIIKIAKKELRKDI